MRGKNNKNRLGRTKHTTICYLYVGTRGKKLKDPGERGFPPKLIENPINNTYYL